MNTSEYEKLDYEMGVWDAAVGQAELYVESLLPRELPTASRNDREDGRAGRRRDESIEGYAVRCQKVLDEALAKLAHAREKAKDTRLAKLALQKGSR